MSVHLTDGGVIFYQGMLAQATLLNKRPSQARKLAPVSKGRCWSIFLCTRSTLTEIQRAANALLRPLVND